MLSLGYITSIVFSNHKHVRKVNRWWWRWYGTSSSRVKWSTTTTASSCYVGIGYEADCLALQRIGFGRYLEHSNSRSPKTKFYHDLAWSNLIHVRFICGITDGTHDWKIHLLSCWQPLRVPTFHVDTLADGSEMWLCTWWHWWGFCETIEHRSVVCLLILPTPQQQRPQYPVNTLRGSGTSLPKLSVQRHSIQVVF